MRCWPGDPSLVASAAAAATALTDRLNDQLRRCMYSTHVSPVAQGGAVSGSRDRGGRLRAGPVDHRRSRPDARPTQQRSFSIAAANSATFVRPEWPLTQRPYGKIVARTALVPSAVSRTPTTHIRKLRTGHVRRRGGRLKIVRTYCVCSRTILPQKYTQRINTLIPTCET